MKDLNPAPKLKNPDRVTKRMVTVATHAAGIHARIRVKNHHRNAGEAKWLVGWETTHDVCTNLDRAIRLARAAKMPVNLSGPHGPYTSDKPGTKKALWWEVDIPPAKGRCYRRFRAKSAAKAICAALLDWIEHPADSWPCLHCNQKLVDGRCYTRGCLKGNEDRKTNP